MYCGVLQTIIVPVQASKHEFELFFMNAKKLCELLKVQYTIVVGVPSLHHLKTQTARSVKNKYKKQNNKVTVSQKVGCKHKCNKCFMFHSPTMMICLYGTVQRAAWPFCFNGSETKKYILAYPQGTSEIIS